MALEVVEERINQRASGYWGVVGYGPWSWTWNTKAERSLDLRL